MFVCVCVFGLSVRLVELLLYVFGCCELLCCCVVVLLVCRVVVLLCCVVDCSLD